MNRRTSMSSIKMELNSPSFKTSAPEAGMTNSPSNPSDLAAMAAAAAGPSRQMAPNATGDQPPQQEVDEFLRRKRKAREHKACYPCRQRKVKCDLSRPCQTCRDRDHAHLCDYDPPGANKRVNTGNDEFYNGFAMSPESSTLQTTPATHVTLPRADFDMLCRKLNGLEHSMDELRRELQHSRSSRTDPLRRASLTSIREGTDFSNEHQAKQRQPSHAEVHGFHTRNTEGDVVHVGASSIPAMLHALGQGDSEGARLQDLLGQTTLPLFGLDNESATYPFVALWGLRNGSLDRAKQLADMIPPDTQLLGLVNAYTTLAYVVFAGIVDPAQLEKDVKEFAAQRASNSPIKEQQIWGKSLTWVALLFAVLACGAQCSNPSRKEREVQSQLFICCSMECLRITNFLSQANLESVQALVVIGNAMTNNLNAGTAWSFHGVTIRIAQTLGLHHVCPPIVAKEEIYPRSRIWWAILWLDSIISIGYDRPSSYRLDEHMMPMPMEFGKVGHYHEAMYQLCKVALDIVRERALLLSPHERWQRTEAHREAIDHIYHNAPAYLRDSRRCSTGRETLEHWGMYLHASYALSELYRPSLSPACDRDFEQQFRPLCIEHLGNAVEAYLGLNNITVLAKHSWSATQRALSCALLLGIIHEHEHSDRARELVFRFMQVLRGVANQVDPSEISGPIRRGLDALTRLNITAESVANSSSSVKPKLPNGIAAFSPVSPEGFGIGVLNDESSPHSLLHSILWGKDASRTL